MLCVNRSAAFANAYARWYETIFYPNIALIIKRTWSAVRTFALELCKTLAAHNVRILKGREFIEWSHSKVQQYLSLEAQQVLPKSVILDNVLLPMPAGLNFPLVVKKDSGCLADGVYLVADAGGLQQLINNLRIENYNQKLLLQKYIPNPSNPELSTYYRINVINNAPHSVIQFQLRWIVSDQGNYKILKDFAGADQKAMPLSTVDPAQLQQIITSAGFNLEFVGLDVIQGDRLYLLEMNDGSNISLTDQLLSAWSGVKPFSLAIAEYCVNLAHQERRTYAARTIWTWCKTAKSKTD